MARIVRLVFRNTIWYLVRGMCICRSCFRLDLNICIFRQDKIAARKARREAEARRLADETAARLILEEQSKSVVTKQELTAESIIVPDVPLPTESTEEKVEHCSIIFMLCFPNLRNLHQRIVVKKKWLFFNFPISMVQLCKPCKNSTMEVVIFKNSSVNTP